MAKTEERSEKIDGFFGISCYRDEIANWRKYLVPKREKASHCIRKILNQAAEIKKAELQKSQTG